MSKKAASTNADDPFGYPGQAQLYTAYRPSYPDSVFSRIIAEAETRGLTNGTLVDIATGTGKVIASLAPHFKSAKGYDRSKAQLACAVQGSNVEYAEADACSIPLPDGSASVITIGQALHWLDIQTFGKEARRLLKPNGLVVVLCYGTCRMPACRSADAAFMAWYESLNPYWDCARELLDDGFHGVNFDPLQEVSRYSTVETVHITPSHLSQYLRTWSSYNIQRTRNPTAPDSVELLEAELTAIAEQEGLKDRGYPVEFYYFAVFLQPKGP